MHFSLLTLGLTSAWLGRTCLATPATSSTTSPYPTLNADDNFAAEMMTSVNATSDKLSKRQPGGVLICTDIYFTGTCGYAKQPFDECIRLTAPYWHTISSIGPDEYNALELYSDYDCTDQYAITMVYPGETDLRTRGKVPPQTGSWNDHIGSFIVRQIPGAACLGYDTAFVDSFPDTNCNWCCNKCTQGGYDCCPAGAGC